MQFGDRPQVDGEHEFNALAFAQAEIGGLDEDTRGAEIDGATQAAAGAGNGDVDGGAGAMPGVQSTFQDPTPNQLLLLCCVAEPVCQRKRDSRG